jgi:hypothetical protein
MCFVSDSPDEGPAKWGDDEDTPDRPLTADHVDARFYLPSMQTPGRPVKELDPRVRFLDCPERTVVTLGERARDPSGACESVGGATRVAQKPRVHRSTRVQVPDELLVGVVPLAFGS